MWDGEALILPGPSKGVPPMTIDALDPADALGLAERHARDATCGWSLGVFGAVAEFMRDADEDTVIDRRANRLELSTARGALRLDAHPAVQVIAYETPSRHAERRRPGVALCLPQDRAQRAARAVLTALGPDAQAIRPEDRVGEVFDLGLGTPTLDALIRTTDADLIAALRAAEGATLFARPDLLGQIAASGPHRVFLSTLGRIEVFQPIPPPDGTSPEGPHTHLLPKLLAHKLGHAANLPIPDGLAVCLSIHPLGEMAVR